MQHSHVRRPAIPVHQGLTQQKACHHTPQSPLQCTGAPGSGLPPRPCCDMSRPSCFPASCSRIVRAVYALCLHITAAYVGICTVKNIPSPVSVAGVECMNGSIPRGSATAALFHACMAHRTTPQPSSSSTSFIEPCPQRSHIPPTTPVA